MKNFILSLGAIVLLNACSPAHSTDQAATAPLQLPVYLIQESTAETSLEYPATVEGTVDIELRPQVSGTLERIMVDEGEYVEKGKPVFAINDLPFREALNHAIANFHAAEAALVQSELEVAKYTPLVEKKVVSEFQLKTLEASRQLALSNLEQAKAQVESAKINLSYTKIHAPVSGYIGRLPKKQGTLVGPADQSPLTTLSDVHEVHVYFALGETDFIRFTDRYEGETLTEKIKNLPPVTLVLADHSKYSELGKVDVVDGQFNKNTGTITFRATFPNKQGLLRSGNTGRIVITHPHMKAILVPQQSTFEIQDKVFVVAVDDQNQVVRKPIQVSGTSGDNYLVSGGLNEGDRIVFKGFETLQDGAIISPESSETNPAKP
ncbi:efflux RND transporter periplasmic adaptor subunit [Algoriphagus sp. D3-2-R+10]|uniref:efflux RND transporter periplasmic adaptor subunit n=1 Tax=Algoriphagus aurantiacus TaxID=3103948 RepID=UPI002B3FA577|nr:efflux RND transporter periplasmic adaptor subunit [Algoriphagus sp. D3-2-R+10]MEB2775387.1 efflux RND transporter periplasmic adaptor subunit [Algoriphagus sp. D3-2-R+10]